MTNEIKLNDPRERRANADAVRSDSSKSEQDKLYAANGLLNAKGRRSGLLTAEYTIQYHAFNNPTGVFTLFCTGKDAQEVRIYGSTAFIAELPKIGSMIVDPLKYGYVAIPHIDQGVDYEYIKRQIDASIKTIPKPTPNYSGPLKVDSIGTNHQTGIRSVRCFSDIALGKKNAGWTCVDSDVCLLLPGESTREVFLGQTIADYSDCELVIPNSRQFFGISFDL